MTAHLLIIRTLLFLAIFEKDNAEQFAAEMFAKDGVLNPKDPDNMCHGGPFATTDLGESEVAKLGLKETKG